MFALEKHPLVDCDLEEAALWYAGRDAQVAARFINAAEQANPERSGTHLALAQTGSLKQYISPCP